MAFQPQHQPDPAAASSTGNFKLRQRRSKKACHECHARKVRCDVSQRGVPCSNCIELPAHCAIRRRKNQRADATPPEEATPAVNSFESPGLGNNRQNGNNVSFDGWRMGPYQESSTSHPIKSLNHPPVADQEPNWNVPDNAEDEGGPTTSSSLGADFDLSTLEEIEGLFTSTDAALLPSIQQPFALPPLDMNHRPSMPDAPSMLPNNILNFEDKTQSKILGLGLPASDRNYLQSEACFDLPSASAFRTMMQCYFRSIHPNLPVVNEAQFWALWNGTHFDLGDSSFLVVQAMVFAAVGLVDERVVQELGYVDKRKARTAFYRKAKLLFDFGVERDPYCNAQACLLLTYWAPNHNNARINSFWLMNAVRFARLAKADTFPRIQDPAQASSLKRLWWCVLLRDRILSLGLRRPLQIAQDVPSESNVPTVEDFQSELGRSIVHEPETQLQIFNVISMACRLALSITPALRILYTVESIEDRTKQAGESLYETSEAVQQALQLMRHWYQQANRAFPFPISLDDTPDTICIFGNMLFVYYDAVVVALYSHTVLLHQVFPTRTALFPLEKSRESIEEAIEDTTKRITELVQIRLVKHLPISAAALLSLPLLLQAVNICASRGTQNEAVEMRKLDIYTKTLRSQQASFEGADFCSDLLGNIMAYAEEDDQFSAKKHWEGGTDTSHSAVHSSAPSEESEISPAKRKLTWEQILHRRPRLYLRLILYLDIALCTGNAPKEVDFPSVLRRSGLGEEPPEVTQVYGSARR